MVSQKERRRKREDIGVRFWEASMSFVLSKGHSIYPEQ